MRAIWATAIAVTMTAISMTALSGPATAETTTSHGISAFGALKYGPDFTHFDYVVPGAPKGGAVSMRPTLASRTFDSFNPYIFKGDPADGTDLLFDTLMARAFDEPDAMYGLLAESVEMPADRSYAIFTLRPEARFRDGSAVTAEDVAWSITALRDKSNPRFRLTLRDVETISVLGPLTVRFDFREGAALRDQAATVADMPIFSKAYFETRDFEEPSLEAPMASGPYELGEIRQGRTVTYVRRDDYWAKDLPVRRGQFNFDDVTFEYFLDQDVGLEAFKAGEFDLIEVFSSKNWATAFTFAAADKGWVVTERIGDSRPSGTQGWWLNTRREKFADPRVRAALDLAFDFELTRKQIFYGQYSRTDSFFENTEDLQASGEITPAEQALLAPFQDALPAAVFDAPAYVPPVTKGDGNIRRSIRRAAKLLDDAGWTVQDGKRVNAAGEALEIEFLDRIGSGFDRITGPFIANLKVLGIEALYRTVDAAQYEQRQKSFDFDIVSGRFPLSSTPGPELRGYLSSASAGQEGSFNLAGVASPAIDAMLERIAGAGSRAELQNAARALDRVFRAGHYWVPHWYSGSHRLAYWDLFGRPADRGVAKPPYRRAILHTWWYDPAKAAALAEKRGF